MKSKDKILNYLIRANGEYVSGEEISEALGISRNAVWKNINALKRDGLNIDGVTSKGYRLITGDMLLAEEIKKYLTDKSEVIVLPVCASTNETAKKLASEGKEEWTAVISDEQTEGKGRRGRNFYSPKGAGLYISVIVKPKDGLLNALSITCAAAVAAAESIESVADVKADIKWVNDIYIGGKKAVGILTEGLVDLESGNIVYAVCGSGFNVYDPTDGYPDEIKETARSIFGKSEKIDGIRNRLAGVYIEKLKYYLGCGSGEVYEKYKSRSFVLGKEIDIISIEGKERGIAVDISKDYRLIAELKGGKKVELFSGEISIVIK